MFPELTALFPMYPLVTEPEDNPKIVPEILAINPEERCCKAICPLPIAPERIPPEAMLRVEIDPLATAPERSPPLAMWKVKIEPDPMFPLWTTCDPRSNVPTVPDAIFLAPEAFPPMMTPLPICPLRTLPLA